MSSFEQRKSSLEVIVANAAIKHKNRKQGLEHKSFLLLARKKGCPQSEWYIFGCLTKNLKQSFKRFMTLIRITHQSNIKVFGL